MKGLVDHIRITIAFGSLFLASPCFANGIALYPDASLTPGVADPAVTQADIQSTICVRGYTGTVRNVSQQEKDQVFNEYNVPLSDAHLYEVDHFISLELGGSNDIRNLWPQLHDPNRQQGADEKDKVENELHAQVCAGRLTLAEAQRIITTDWYNYYLQHVAGGVRGSSSAGLRRKPARKGS